MTRPEISSRALRQRLFLPALTRLLGDPVDFPPQEDFGFDSIKVRIDQAVAAVERRSEELAEAAYARSGACRFGAAASALVGIGALVTALGVPQYAVLAYLVAGIELVLVLRFSRLSRRHAVDCLELRRLAERYRPELDRAATAAELRTLAARIGREMAEIWIAPPGGEQGSAVRA